MPGFETNLNDITSLDAKQAPPCTFVLFGATGDLAARKIAPALYNLARNRLLHPNTTVLLVARREKTDDQMREELLEAIDEQTKEDLDCDCWEQFSRRWHYHITHADEPEEYQTLSDRLDELDEKYQTGGNRVFYIAMLPQFFDTIADNLGNAGLNKPAREDAFVRLVVEKPFGRDLISARQLNKAILKHFDESQIFRIDHYLGKETVQNILVMRFANAIFEPLMNRNYVDHVQISTCEKAGMEGRRGPYYEKSGALRDMIQNHMLQLLTLTAMDVPSRLEGNAIRSEKVKVLKCIRRLTPNQVATDTVRGQYIGADDMPAYTEEEGVDDDSQVETYAAVKFHVDNWRWAGVPFYLRTGKRLARKASQISIFFKREPVSLFYEAGCDTRSPNRLDIRITPDEGLTLRFDAKVPGVRMLLRPVTSDFKYETSFESASPEAYEHLLLDAIQGDPTLFIRDDEVEEAWRITDGIRKAWDNAGQPELLKYKPDGWGPDAADAIFGDPYKRWMEL
ncbi:MAG: glucose-6-phosphate dehydrogenase [Phycisphaerae bacterium]